MAKKGILLTGRKGAFGERFIPANSSDNGFSYPSVDDKKPDCFYYAEDVCKLTGFSRDKLDYQCRKKTIPAPIIIKVGYRHLKAWSKSKIDDWIKTNLKPPQ